MSLKESANWILSNYAEARTESFSGEHPVYRAFQDLAEELRQTAPVVERESSLLVQASVGRGNWAKVPWIALMDSRNTTTTQRGVYCVYLFREDLTGVYVTLNQGVTEPKRNHGTREAREILRRRAELIREFCSPLQDEGFLLDHSLDLRASTNLGRDYEHSTVAHKLYDREDLPPDDALVHDLDVLLSAYDRFLESAWVPPVGGGNDVPTPPKGDVTANERMQSLIDAIASEGYVFEPWQIAQYVTAVRTKPFCILAGVSGTGKSKLPALVANATGCEDRLIPVRPDWADSSDVLGYVDLQGQFRPGSVLEVMHQAMEEDDRFWVCVIDEMNLARVEQYFAEVLSQIENRRPIANGGFASGRLLSQALPKEEDAEWAEVVIPPNLAIVGTVNMDETTHGFSRKVLDRAFTIELSDVSLERWKDQQTSTNSGAETPPTWPLSTWQPRAIRLSGLPDLTDHEYEIIEDAVGILEEANAHLKQAQLQVGYRTRDEVALFVLHANEIAESFVTRDGDRVDPIDLALHMKILPRLVGGSGAVRRALIGLLGWAHGSTGLSEGDASVMVESWSTAGRPGAIEAARFPRTAARLCLMWGRLQAEGYTSFWL